MEEGRDRSDNEVKIEIGEQRQYATIRSALNTTSATASQLTEQVNLVLAHERSTVGRVLGSASSGDRTRKEREINQLGPLQQHGCITCDYQLSCPASPRAVKVVCDHSCTKRTASGQLTRFACRT